MNIPRVAFGAVPDDYVIPKMQLTLDSTALQEIQRGNLNTITHADRLQRGARVQILSVAPYSTKPGSTSQVVTFSGPNGTTHYLTSAKPGQFFNACG